jgi:hypothetical protein
MMPMMEVKKATRQKARYMSLSTTDVPIRNPAASNSAKHPINCNDFTISGTDAFIFFLPRNSGLRLSTNSGSRVNPKVA